MNDDLGQTPSSLRVRLFGEADVEGEQVDPTVKLRPLSRALLARLALAQGERLDTEELARLLVVKVASGIPVAPDKLSSAQQQLRNAQWELRKRLGDGRGEAMLLGAGRRWVALEGARTDYREFLEAVDDGDGERARAIASRGEFLAGIDDPWTAAYRRTVQERLRALEPLTGGEPAGGREKPAESTASPAGVEGSTRARAPRPGNSSSRPLKLAALAALLLAVTAIGVAELFEDRAAIPDASKAPPDITPHDDAVEMAPKRSGRCQQVLPGVSPPMVTTISATGQTLAEIRTYYQPKQHQTCAKLVKPEGSPLNGELTHLALTLCGDDNQCAHDWHAYRIDAGPVVVASRDGCVSWRVSIADRAGKWLVRDRVGHTGCA
ncbi:MAG TPA: hypothetical protein VGO80_09920 [Solirubrobacteraceae bacterium]|nr:hypothetical protein [Solirubrobacteraceae bacterium]